MTTLDLVQLPKMSMNKIRLESRSSKIETVHFIAHFQVKSPNCKVNADNPLTETKARGLSMLNKFTVEISN